MELATKTRNGFKNQRLELDRRDVAIPGILSARAANHFQKNCNNGNHKQNMDDATRMITKETNSPRNNQNDSDDI